MAINVEGWLKRSEEFTKDITTQPHRSGEILQFAISMAAELYGPSSQQVEIIKSRVDSIAKDKNSGYIPGLIYEFARGSVVEMSSQIKGGLIQNLRLSVVGEVLADLIGLAREALGSSLQVAAVLTAAAYEDLLRKLAQEKAGITARIKLEEVVRELKDKKVLHGGEPGVVQSFLKFRNDSLHADWNNVTESQVSSCLALLDSLIVKHLS